MPSSIHYLHQLRRWSALAWRVYAEYSPIERSLDARRTDIGLTMDTLRTTGPLRRAREPKPSGLGMVSFSHFSPAEAERHADAQSERHPNSQFRCAEFLSPPSDDSPEASQTSEEPCNAAIPDPPTADGIHIHGNSAPLVGPRSKLYLAADANASDVAVHHDAPAQAPLPPQNRGNRKIRGRRA